MADAKYFAKIIAAQQHDLDHPPPPLPPFDFEDLGAKTVFGRATARAIELAIPWLLWLARRFFPVFRFNGLYWITRHADVVAALAMPDTLRVPYGPEMRELAAGQSGAATFVLGLDGPEQVRQNAIIRRVILPDDLAPIRDWSRRFAQALIDGGAGRLDVVNDFSIRIPTEICRRYFGLNFSDPTKFAEWAIAISALLFADPGGDPVKRRLGLAGAARLRRVIDAAINRAGNRASNPADPFDQMTLVERLVSLARNEPDLELKHAEIRAIILGLIVGFIPTNGLAAAKMIELIMARSGALDAARKAGGTGDEAAMRRIVLEAGRLNPALAPGQWRFAHAAVEIGGKHIPQGATVMVSTMSAMRDARVFRAPGTFDPDAGNDSDLVFGHGVHACLGKRLATEIITQMFVPLFALPDLRRARGKFGRMQRVGYFPQRLDLEYESAAATQTMIVAAVPLAADADRERLAQQLAALSNPARPDVRASLDATDIVHFASGSIIDAADDVEPPHPPPPSRPYLLLEFNVDGDRNAALDRIDSACALWLHPLLQLARPTDGRSPRALLSDCCLDLHFSPWGATGLNFFGTGDFPVAAVDRQHALRAVARQRLDDFLGHHSAARGGLDNRAILAMGAVRRAIRTTPELADLDAFLVQPMRKQLALSQWRKPESFWAPARLVLRNGLLLRLGSMLAATMALFMLLAHIALSRGTDLSLKGTWTRVAQWWDGVTQLHWAAMLSPLPYLGLLVTLALVMTVLFWGGFGLLCYRALRRVEDREPTEDSAAGLDRIRTIAALEDAPGYAQNHILAVTQIKSGLVRRFALAFALWGIRQSLHWFRPGFVVTMGTIHYAKWFRLPGSDKLVFQSNYDGSWESYLEDFITRAHQGQTAAWSNGVGFPHTRGLIGAGAEDGDRFKRWVRRQQVPTAFWYSRFPDLTTEQIRNAALIHDGLARAHTDTAARAWLDLMVGSAQRQPFEMESPEIQTIVFRGLKRALYTACIPLTLPETRDGRSRWLTQLRDGAGWTKSGDENGWRLSFGKFPSGKDQALYLAFSPHGLARMGAAGDAMNVAIPILEAFPSAFAMGMANRARALGDIDPANQATMWRWRDTPVAGAADEADADAILMIYAPDATTLDSAIAAQIRLLDDHGGRAIGPPIRTATLGDEQGTIQTDTKKPASYEHFGFRDGLTTPVIRGSEQFAPGSSDRDVVEPGEFILGYRNNQGYFAPSIMVAATSDAGDNLPIAADVTPFGFADFRNADEQFRPRDFGRNGTFLVLRQLAQDVAGFHDQTTRCADALNARYGEAQLQRTVGTKVDEQWIAAKLMGRWRHGQPLIGNPTYRNAFGDDHPDNDFAFGRDDPRGHQCPLGAHIRRANPRDSREPDDPLEQTISNRHRILRRGRTYFYDPAKQIYPVASPAPGVERGLLFVAICADLERQFEMVQQSWVANPAFHGLEQEPDPIAGPAGPASSRRFTIPTSAGPLSLSGLQSHVTMKGGGYFFLPSRSAINYLIDLASIHDIDHFLAPDL